MLVVVAAILLLLLVFYLQQHKKKEGLFGLGGPDFLEPPPGNVGVGPISIQNPVQPLQPVVSVVATNPPATPAPTLPRLSQTAINERTSLNNYAVISNDASSFSATLPPLSNSTWQDKFNRKTFSFESDKTYAGNTNVYKETGTTKVSECVRLCSNDPNCKILVADRNKDDRIANCSFRTKTGGTVMDAGADNGIWTKTSTPSVQKAYSTLDGYDILGRDLTEHNVNTSECATLCDTMEACKSFVTSTVEANKCFLKTEGAHSVNVEVGPNYQKILYTKEQLGWCPNNDEIPRYDPSGSNCNKSTVKFPNGDFDSFDLGNSFAENESACESLCKKTKKRDLQCKAYTYSSAEKKCNLKHNYLVLKKNAGDLNKNSALLSPYGICEDGALKLDASGTNCNLEWKKIKGVYSTDPNLYNTTDPKIRNTSETECKRICKSTPGCKGFDFGEITDTTSSISGGSGQLGSSVSTSTTTNACTLRSAIGKLTRDTTDKKSVYLLDPYGMCEGKTASKSDAIGSNCNDYFDKILGTKYSGNEILEFKSNEKSTVAENEQVCADQCSSTMNCNLYSYDTGTQICSLFTSAKDAVQNQTSIAGTRVRMEKCPNKNEYKTDLEGANCFVPFGKCMVGNLTQAKIDEDGSNCYGKCTVGDRSKYKKDATTAKGCFGPCTVGNVTEWKIDASGSNCYGKCIVGDTTLYKQDGSSNSNRGCYGKCTVGDINEWKMDSNGSNCFGVCTNPTPFQTYKFDSFQTHCWGACDRDATYWKLDASGEKGCYGPCDFGDTTLWKDDASGSNCYGKCTLGDRTKYKLDTVGSGCFGLCPEGSPYTYKRGITDRCTSRLRPTDRPEGVFTDTANDYCLNSPEDILTCENIVDAVESTEAEPENNPIDSFTSYLRRYFLERNILGNRNSS